MKPNLDRALKIKGWATRKKLIVLARLAQNCQHIIEVGAYQGRSTRAMIDNAPWNMRMIVVDLWDYKYKGGRVTMQDFSVFLGNTRDVRNRITTYRMRSEFAPHHIERIDGLHFADLVYIDGGHEYETVQHDIEKYRQFVKPGGMMCGDDYHKSWLGVMKAVNAAFDKIKVEHTIWQVQL